MSLVVIGLSSTPAYVVCSLRSADSTVLSHEHGDGQRADTARHRRISRRFLRQHPADAHRPPARFPCDRTRRACPSSCGKCARPASRSDIRLMPTSMTIAPGWIKSAVRAAGRPRAATRISPCRQIAARSWRLRMADRDRGVLVKQQHRHRLADDVAAAHHHRALPAIGIL